MHNNCPAEMVIPIISKEIVTHISSHAVDKRFMGLNALKAKLYPDNVRLELALMQ